MDDDIHKQMVFDANRKSVGIAYILWFFLGFFGVHRFYSGATKSGVAQLLLAISIIGWLVLIPWLLIDLALIPGLIRDENMKTINMLNYGDRRGAVPATPMVKTEADRKREAMLEDLRTTGYSKQHRDNSHLYR